MKVSEKPILKLKIIFILISIYIITLFFNNLLFFKRFTTLQNRFYLIMFVFIDIFISYTAGYLISFVIHRVKNIKITFEEDSEDYNEVEVSDKE